MRAEDLDHKEIYVLEDRCLAACHLLGRTREE
jgi:hypothetical protein